MDDHPLLRAVMRWPGRVPTQLAFEALGFTLHRTWQDRIMDFCGREQSALINRYWDETALETMQSLGRSDPDQRFFVIEPKCRSAFLDELFTARDFLEPPFRCPPLVKGLFHHMKRIWFDREFREAEAAFFDCARQAERERFSVQTTGWTGRKRDVIPFAELFCEALGFKPLRKCWRKSAGDLVFEVGVDLGGSHPYYITPPMTFRIFHIDEPGFAYDLRGHMALNRLVPGFQQYAAGGDPADCVLNIRAHIELFNVIAEQLRQHQEA